MSYGYLCQIKTKLIIIIIIVQRILYFCRKIKISFFVATITHLASHTNTSLKILEKTLNKCSRHYDKFVLVGDFNGEESEPCLSQFLFEYNTKNIVKENPSFKNAFNPSCIDLFITNRPLSFQNTIAFSKVLPHFHKMVITVMKMSFKKHSLTERYYRDYDRTKLKNNLNEKLSEGISMNHLKLLSLKC